MADTEQARELVFCHACENEWLRGEHGLECPQCGSEIVEIVSHPDIELRWDVFLLRTMMLML